jgi:hypothetical protein
MGCSDHFPIVAGKNAAENSEENMELSDNQRIEGEMSAGQAEGGEEEKQLMHVGAATAVAIAVHIFPEGLVAFCWIYGSSCCWRWSCCLVSQSTIFLKG